MKKFENPVFVNDPFMIVAEAFENLYPDRKYKAQFVEKIEDEEGHEAFGETFFPDDKSTPIVSVSGNIPMIHMIEIFAHELAHVETPDDKNHGREWDEAFEKIAEEYHKILERRSHHVK